MDAKVLDSMILKFLESTGKQRQTKKMIRDAIVSTSNMPIKLGRIVERLGVLRKQGLLCRWQFPHETLTWTLADPKSVLENKNLDEGSKDSKLTKVIVEADLPPTELENLIPNLAKLHFRNIKVSFQ